MTTTDRGQRLALRGEMHPDEAESSPRDPGYRARPGSGSSTTPAAQHWTSAGTRFRPDLEGLRAIAVLLVLAFHAGIPGFDGGYVGVDVFFVLSGFLITGLIVRELRDTGAVSLVAFYARRARRLLPAAAVALVATVVASAILLPPLRVGGIAADGVAAALYASNIRFAAQATDYLQSELDPSPLLHYWSLGVEEQFYLFWPAILLFVTRRGGVTIRRIGLAVAIVGLGSLALSLLLTQIAEPWAFFSLPARAWELALGAGLALVAAQGLSLTPVLAKALAVAGISAVVAAGVLFDTATPFPGTAALLPTLGAVAVIGAGLGEPLSRASRLLAAAPLRWFGRISYSLYLWHWPILVIPAAALGVALDLPWRILLAVISIGVAAASQRWIEEPFRHGRFVGLLPRRNLILAGLLTVVVAGLSVGVASGAPGGPTAADKTSTIADNPTIDHQLDQVFGSPKPSASSGGHSAGASPVASQTSAPPSSIPVTATGAVPTNLLPSLGGAADDLPRTYADGCHLGFSDTTSGTCAYGDKTSSTIVVLFGDSHAAQWFPALERLAAKGDWRLISLTKSACAPADITVWNSSLKRGYTECDTWRNYAMKRIAGLHPDLVIVSNSRYDLAINGAPVDATQRQSLWDAALTRTLQKLLVDAPHVVLIGDSPRPARDPPVCLSAHMKNVLACANPRADAVDTDALAAQSRVAAATGVQMIDPTPLICPSEPCPVVVGSLLVYRDTHHMTAHYAAAIAPYLGALLPTLGP